ncbi:RagB/SusD family nutrient uptake outer membrane protein [Flavobacterium ovatum]|uniref:RagB/SusD family nutrient uptake outer membrane protein n=1 Tax=Flavobacterium ovatum TaxID=1928857 RepID=UPI00344C2E85
MKNIKNRLIILLGLALVLNSCQDDFLDQKNPNALPASEFWKTTGDLESGLNAVYHSFKDENCVYMTSENERSDIAYPSYLRPLNGQFEYYEQLFNNTSKLPDNKWSALYQGVFRANQVIEAYDRLKGTFANADSELVALRIYAEARALRGWYYFMLHNSFNKGSVVLFDFVPKDKTQYQKPLSSSDAVLKFYRDDLEIAKEKLLEVPLADNAPAGRFSAGACEALLGKSYLYEGNFTKAATYFKSVIDNYGYELMPNIGSNFTTQDEFNKESILEVNYTATLKADQTNNDQLLSSQLGQQIGAGGWNGSFPATWVIMKYKKDPVDMLDPKNTGLTDVYGVIKNRRYSERASYSIALADDTNPDFGYYGANTTAELAKFDKQHISYWRKYTNWDIQTKDETNTASGIRGRSGVNVRLIRLADVFLMYAECMIESSNLGEATKYINKVRKRSHVVLLGSATNPANSEFNDGKTSFDEIVYTKTTLTEHLRHTERPLELAFEGGDNRLLDLRRWGITKQRFQYLSTLRYDNYNLKANTNGTHPIRFRCVVYDTGDIPDANAVNQRIAEPELNEFVLAAANYDAERHGYLPIPLSEINANSSLYK